MEGLDGGGGNGIKTQSLPLQNYSVRERPPRGWLSRMKCMLFGDTKVGVHTSECARVCTHEHVFLCSNGWLTRCLALSSAF